jgi:hypothetical protein
MVVLLAAMSGGGAWADGDEILGPPSIAIAAGSGIVMAGTGLDDAQPGTIDVTVPSGAVVQQVLLYWYGRGSADGVTGDDQIEIEGNLVDGTLIGEPVGPLPFLPSQVYRADITGLGLVTDGANSLSVEGLDFTFHNSGAGVLVIFAEPMAGFSVIDIRDGHDFGAINQGITPPMDDTVAQTYTFPASQADRVASLTVFVGDANADRPDGVTVQVGANPPVQFNDVMNSADGPLWDTIGLDVPIPAGETTLTVRGFSRDDETEAVPDSLCWMVSALVVPEPGECRVTGGGVDEFGNWDHTMAKGHDNNGNGGVNRYTCGGQAGAPTGSQPQPYGEWTHHQVRGPDGRWVFHAGTASAPPGTFITLIDCADPDNCEPARRAPFKQINFLGVGTFRNIFDGPNLGDAEARETFHAFEVHIEDLGEPGNNNRQKNPGPNCEDAGYEGTLANCDCPDFYRITIYEAFDPDSEDPNMTDVIYEVYGYLDGGNFQIHPPVGSH